MDGRTPNQQQLYDSGRRGESAPTHLTINERDAFQQGEKDRKKARLSHGPDHGAGAGGGGFALILGIVILGTLGVMLAIAAAAGIAAFGSAVLLYLLSRLWPGFPSQGYWQAYRTAFLCLAVFIVLVVAPLLAAEFLVENLHTNSSFVAYVVETTPVLLGSWLTRLGAPASQTLLPLEQWLQLVAMWRPDASSVATWASVLLFVPPTLGATLTAVGRIDFTSAIAAIAGSLAVTVFAILPGAALAVWGTSWLVHNAQPVDLPSAVTLGSAALAGAAMILVYALLGALITGLVLLAALKLSRVARDEGFGRAYRTAFLGLAACGVVTMLAFFWFRGGDGLWAWSTQVTAAEFSGQAVDLAALWQTTLTSWPVLLPGLVVAGAIVCSRHPSPFAGMLGYGGAVVLSAVTAMPLLVLCLVAAVKLARSGLLS